jgi:phage pi2 protein 07
MSENTIYAQIKNFIDSARIGDKEDVKQFDKIVFSNIDKNPELALKYGKILEHSLFDLIKESKTIKNMKKKQNPSLNFLIESLKSEYKMINSEIYDNLHFIRLKRNREYHFDKESGVEQFNESKYSVATDCGIKILQYLLWKYECCLKGFPEKLPKLNENKLFLNLKLPIIFNTSDNISNIPVINKKEDSELMSQNIDTWGILSVKSRLHAVSELTADEAMSAANAAMVYYPYDSFTRLISVVVSLRWSRGYSSALKRILNIPKPIKRVGDYQTNPVKLPKAVNNGLLTAYEEEGKIIISVESVKALEVLNVPQNEKMWFISSINNNGRLGSASSEYFTLVQRIQNIELPGEEVYADKLRDFLNKNSEALLPLVARYGMLGADWLLPLKTDLKKQQNFIPPCPELWYDENKEKKSSSDTDKLNKQYFSAQNYYKINNAQDQMQSADSLARQLLNTEQVRTLFGDAVDKEPEKVLKQLETMLKGMEKPGQPL